MPFDGTDYQGRPGPPKREPSETGVLILVAVLAISLLLLPVSLGGLVDLIRYVQRP